jgi:sec-independent protein translocase protein TatB
VFDIGTGEIIALAVLALLVLGPDKLPRYAAEAARFLRQMRTLASDAKNEVSRELGPELNGLGLRELNPRHERHRRFERQPGFERSPLGTPRRRCRATADASGRGAVRPRHDLTRAPG